MVSVKKGSRRSSTVNKEVEQYYIIACPRVEMLEQGHEEERTASQSICGGSKTDQSPQV